MKRLLFTAVLTLPLCLANPSAAQRGAGGPPQMIPLATGSISIHELPSNQESKVETDRFIGYADKAVAGGWNGFMTRSMLRAGDPYKPGPSGNVLEYRDDLGVATLEPHTESGSNATDEISFYFVQGGEGRVDTGPGTPSFNLRTGIGVLVAPGVKQHFVNTGDKQLSMITLTWKNNDGMKVKLPIKVADTNTKGGNGLGAHWIMAGRGMFGNEDGVNITLSMIYIPANTYSGPHAHSKGVEEIWVKTGYDTGYAILGSEIRKIVGAGAFLAPPNNLTTHSSMNTNEDHPAVWLYLSRRAPSAAAGAGGQ